jgi:TrpR-related protein YerC/YecD
MDWKKPENKALVEAVLTLKSSTEAKAFLRDLLTEGEIEEFAKRLQTAALLTEKVPYSSIVRQTGFSSTTIARVSKWLHHGTGGYETVLARVAH